MYEQKEDSWVGKKTLKTYIKTSTVTMCLLVCMMMKDFLAVKQRESKKKLDALYNNKKEHSNVFNEGIEERWVRE